MRNRLDRVLKAKVWLSTLSLIAVTVVMLGLLTAVGAQPHSETPSLADEISMRDQLIANQESLLNTYRCQFNIDTQVVPNGCPLDGAPVLGVAPPNPNSQDRSLRDQLIANQESLLNTYRCQFNIDTQVVPNGCPLDPAMAAVRNTVVAIQSYTTFETQRKSFARELQRELVATITGNQQQLPSPLPHAFTDCTLTLDLAQEGTRRCLTSSVDNKIAAAIAEIDTEYRAFNLTYGTKCSRYVLHHEDEKFKQCVLQIYSDRQDPLPNVLFYGKHLVQDGFDLSSRSSEDTLIDAINTSSNPEIAALAEKMNNCNMGIGVASSQNGAAWFYSSLTLYVFSLHPPTQETLRNAIYNSLDAVRSLGVTTLA